MSLPAGYSYQTYPDSDFTKFDLELISQPSEASCAAETQAKGGHFFAYNAATKQCAVKNPAAGNGRDTLTLVSSNSYYVIQNVDFAGYFDIQVIWTGPVATSSVTCIQTCAQTAGCVVATYNRAGGCALKKPNANSGVTMGVIIPPSDQVFAICTRNTQCSASQCGTTIADNCGNPLTCPACPPLAPPGCVSTGTVACSVGTCGLEIFDNCGNTLQCPVCAANQSDRPGTLANSLQPSVSVLIVTSPVPVIGSPNTAPSAGLIAGIAVGVIVLLAAIGAFVYSKKSPKSVDAKAVYVNHTTKAASDLEGSSGGKGSDLPVYTGSDLLSSPDRVQTAQIMHCVTSVPGFYSASVNYVPLKDGQLQLVAGQRVYVTSVTADGWCNALISGESGWVHADMLGPIG
ncbi:UNVERIFIED_CONTAM: hypothetical protein HDU68_010918 [Siphonaria sp. JEL0065]|nr:hypothetical protein HDU68_010918 [Siphonaria sp. JEL0065]